MKKKKVIFIMILFLLVCGIGVGGSIIWMRQKESATEEEITVKENQSLIVAQINTINGNEITFAEAEEVDLSSMKGGGMGENQGSFGGGENQSGSSASEGENASPENVTGGEMPGDGDMSSGDMASGNESGRSRKGDENQETSGDEDGKSKSKTMYQVTGKEQTMLIPVGTAVTTQFGTTTTFSRLAAGDMVKILMEKNENNEDVIVGIWMVQ